MGRSGHRVLSTPLGIISALYGRVTALLPLPLARLLGRCLGRLAYYLIPRIRRVGLANLALAYGDSISGEEKRRILKGATANVGIVASEFSRISQFDSAFIDRHVQIRGREHLDQAGCGVLMGAHLGNWEWMAPVLSASGYSVAEVVRPLDNPTLNAFVDRVRTAKGTKTVAKRDAAPELVRLLRNGWFIGILVDQNPRANATPATFFGSQCWATTAPVMIALRAKAPLLPVCMVRQLSGDYIFHIGAPIDLVREGSFRQNLAVNVQRCQDAAETLVRNAPEQWLWLHRRWRERPHLEEAWQRTAGDNS